MKVFPYYDSPYTYGYIDFDKKYTVGEFIEKAVKNNPDVSGCFSIDSEQMFLNYSKGKFLDDKFPVNILNSRIAAVSFYTGWNRADYVITKLDGYKHKQAHRELKEFSINGHRIMAYSRKDAIVRLRHQK